jgi:hypothetical protein
MTIAQQVREIEEEIALILDMVKSSGYDLMHSRGKEGYRDKITALSAMYKGLTGRHYQRWEEEIRE